MMGDGKKLERLSKVRPTRNENGVSVDEVGMDYGISSGRIYMANYEQ
jgi:hypothetical protein